MLNRMKTSEQLQRFIQTVRSRITDAEVGVSSSAIAYYLLLSIFPLIIAIGNILPYLHIDTATVLGYISIIIPEDIYRMLEGTIKELLNTSSGSVLSISALATVWAASRSINGLQTSLNKVYGVSKRSNRILARTLSFSLIFFLLVALVLLTALFTVGQSFFDWLVPYFPLLADVAGIFSAVKWPVTLLGLFATLFCMYWLLPNAKVHVRYIIPGTIFTMIGWMLLTQLFGYYAKYFASSYSSYGIIGSLIVVMLWFNFSATLIIVGGIVNAVTEEYFGGGIIERTYFLPEAISKWNKTKRRRED